jgi:hypothetical protein
LLGGDFYEPLGGGCCEPCSVLIVAQNVALFPSSSKYLYISVDDMLPIYHPGKSPYIMQVQIWST